MKRWLRQGDAVVDVGAHVGLHAPRRQARRSRRPRSRVRTDPDKLRRTRTEPGMNGYTWASPLRAAVGCPRDREPRARPGAPRGRLDGRLQRWRRIEQRRGSGGHPRRCRRCGPARSAREDRCRGARAPGPRRCGRDSGALATRCNPVRGQRHTAGRPGCLGRRHSSTHLRLTATDFTPSTAGGVFVRPRPPPSCGLRRRVGTRRMCRARSSRVGLGTRVLLIFNAVAQCTRTPRKGLTSSGDCRPLHLRGAARRHRLGVRARGRDDDRDRPRPAGAGALARRPAGDRAADRRPRLRRVPARAHRGARRPARSSRSPTSTT